MRSAEGVQPMPVRSVDDYLQMVRDFKKGAVGAVRGNCYLLPDKVSLLVSRGVLDVAFLPGTLAFLERRDGFCQVHYLRKARDRGDGALAGDSLARLDSCVPGILMAEIPFATKFHEDPVPERVASELGVLEGAGFSIVRRSRRLARKPLREGAPTRTGVRVDTACVEDVPAIKLMLDEGFDPLCDYVPDDRELARAVEAGEILCTRDGEGRPVSLLHWDCAGAASELRQLFVSREFRARGCAQALIDLYLRSVPLEASNCVLWVDDENRAALALYDRFGYGFDGRRAVELVKRSRVWT